MARKRSVDANDLCDSPTVVALDPGGTTGWCVLQCHPEALIDPDVMILDNIDHWISGQFIGNEDQQAADIVSLIENWPGCAVLMEDFILRIMTPDRDLLSPVRITAKVEHLLWRKGMTFFRQQPSEAKTTATDSRLKDWGLYKPGEEHGRDATRHAITFMRKAKSRVMLRMYAWEYLYGVGSVYGLTEEEMLAESERIKAEAKVRAEKAKEERQALNGNSKSMNGSLFGFDAERLSRIG